YAALVRSGPCGANARSRYDPSDYHQLRLPRPRGGVQLPRPRPDCSPPQAIRIYRCPGRSETHLAAATGKGGGIVSTGQATASNGIEAVTCAIEHPPHLVLLDLNMPHWDGWTAFSRLDKVTPLLPVIVITARPNQYDKAVRLGVDAFMEKPLNIPILVRAIKRLTSEDKNRHVRRITKRAFVTQLLDNTGS